MSSPLIHHLASLSCKSLPDPFSTSVPFCFPSHRSKTFLPRNPNLPPRLILFRPTAAAADAETQALPQSAIRRIADKLRSLGYGGDDEDDVKETRRENSDIKNASPGEIFVPLPKHLPRYRVGHTIDKSWSTPENPVPEPGFGDAIQRFHELRHEVQRAKEEDKEKRKREGRERVPTLAELTLPKEELKRLRTIGIDLKKKLKVGKAGITEGIVNGIHERWRNSELVKIVCADICRLNMKRTQDLLERKTGGLVVWRSGSNIIMYRGANYQYPYFLADNDSMGVSPESSMNSGIQMEKETDQSGLDGTNSAGPILSNKMAQPRLVQGVGSPTRVRFHLPGEIQLAEEADRLLDGLGPRFTDWWGYEPLPVDADLLPAIVPGYRRPFRLLPYGIKPKLTNDEMTILKRLGRPLPCHFALGRNRKLQGLAASIVRLWEKCEIVKIAVKRGVQNTNSELMAEELKRLTGGTLLSRDKEFIVLYRGKDFLSAAVSLAIEDRRRNCGILEEKPISDSNLSLQEHSHNVVDCGSEDDCDAKSHQKQHLVSEERRLRSTEAAIKRTSSKLQMAIQRKTRAEKLLAELEKEEIHQVLELDKEGITEEERFMLRKVGLRMKPFLLLGRRGVFDGTIENMHLHWKYRELVKIICGARNIEEVHGIARMLEAESGGILVAVEKVSKGYVIIVYRGKNYKRPTCLRPQTLLNKREAMKRSLEAQRDESLKLHVLKLNKSVDDLKLQLAKDQQTISAQSPKQLNHLVSEQDCSETRLAECSSNASPDTHSSCVAASACNQNNGKGMERHGDDSSSYNLRAAMDTSQDNSGTSQSHTLRHFPLNYKGIVNERKAAAEPLHRETNVFVTVNGEGDDTDSTTYPDDLESDDATSYQPEVDSESHVFCGKAGAASVDSANSQSQVLPHKSMENGSSGVPSTALQLSNRERLVLRKQALKMKKRPVLAVGRSNIVTGVAKAIKAHFQKHPLAIVNVKGRAKGTSVQEVVFKLEQATGAVLVSQEPCKVILYRGWGAGVEPGRSVDKSTRNGRDVAVAGEGGVQGDISPELLSAIRIECGLHGNREEGEA